MIIIKCPHCKESEMRKLNPVAKWDECYNVEIDIQCETCRNKFGWKTFGTHGLLTKIDK
jgi:hypothetical protein